MTRDNSLKTLNCPNCGGPLAFVGPQKETRCQFCGTWVTRTGGGSLIPTGDRQSSQVDSGRSQVGRVTCLLIVLGACLALIPVLLTMFNAGQLDQMMRAILSGDTDGARVTMPTLNKRIRVGRSAALIRSPSDAPPDIVALTTQYSLNADTREQRLVALSGVEPKLLWQSEPLGEDVYDVPILANDDFVYLLAKTRLLALHRSDGSTAWEAHLPDVVSLHICRDCVRLADDVIVTLSDDGMLLAFDAQTGKKLWDYVATKDSPRGLYLFGDRVAFMDSDENNDGLLRRFDPASGAMTTLQPACTADGRTEYADWTTPLYPTLDGEGFYLELGFFQRCVQRWDATSGTQLWSEKVPDNPTRDSLPLLTEDAIYLGQRYQLLRLDAETGTSQVLLEDEDYTFVPLALVGDDVLVRGTNRRGSTTFEILRVQPGGEIIWTFDLGTNPPLDPPDAAHPIIDEDDPIWTWRLIEDDLVILRFKRASDDVSHAIELERVDLQTGEGRDRQEIPLKISTNILSAPEFTLWRQEMLWMSMEGQLLGLDAANGEIFYRWP